MGAEVLIQLAVLALIDSTSIGTLIIPLWLLLRRSARGMAATTGLYLGVIGAFYFAIGVVLLLGANAALTAWSQNLSALGESLAFRVLALIAGAVMIVWGFTPRKKTPEDRNAAAPERSVERRWSARIDHALGSPAGLVSLAVVAGLLELPTMLPYLAAVGILTSSGIGVVPSLGILGLYCLIMLVPATVLLIARLAFASRIDEILTRLSARLSSYAAEAMKWVAAIFGILIVRWAGFSADSPVLPLLGITI